MSDNDSKREIPVAWEALEDAFENNAPEVHSYLHLDTGEVVRLVDGVADPAVQRRVATDSLYLPVSPVSSREQYRWMERFIASVEDSALRHSLLTAIDGKGAFRRFKDVLMSYPVERERWFVFRTERLRASMEGWLSAHDIQAIERPEWEVPSADEVKGRVDDAEVSTDEPKTLSTSVRLSRQEKAEIRRNRIHQVVDVLPARDLSTLLAFVEFLRERRHVNPVKVENMADLDDSSESVLLESDSINLPLEDVALDGNLNDTGANGHDG